MNNEQENSATEIPEGKTETTLQTESPVDDALPELETEVVTPNEEPETPASVDEQMDEKAEINRLLDEGYSVKQIIDLGFKRRTAYHYAKLRVKPENAATFCWKLKITQI